MVTLQLHSRHRGLSPTAGRRRAVIDPDSEHHRADPPVLRIRADGRDDVLPLPLLHARASDEV